MTIAKTKTSTEVKQRWEAANYKKYMVRMRIDDDKKLIDFIESEKKKGKNTSDIFKAGIGKLKED